MGNMSLFANRKINFLLLIDITLLVYLSVFVSAFSSLDDTGLMEDLQKGALNFASLAPSGGMTYLRPMTLLTYLVDFNLWGAHPVAFHLTNLILHLANACLVYHLCRTCLPESPKREGSAFLSALFFAVSPLNSESVLWVSGRTDSLCCFFFLCSLLVVVNERLAPLSAAGTLLILYSFSLLAKESSFALLGIVPFYLLTVADRRTRVAKWVLSGTVAIVSASYLLLRLGPRGELDSGTSKIVTKIAHQSVLELAYKSLAAFGFYLKKMAWPFPLNLAIQSIYEPFYAAVGIVAVLVIISCFVRFKVSRLPLLIIVFCLGPPLLALHGSIPWTLYAERYLYLSMTGTALLVGLLAAKSRRIPQPLPFLLIIPLAITTIHRSGQWADPVALWRDTVTNSPGLPQAHVVYAYELIQAGRIADAKKSLQRAREMKFENDLYRTCMTTINRDEGGRQASSPPKDSKAQ